MDLNDIKQTSQREKEHKIKDFNNVYNSMYSNPKLSYLPNWMSTYGAMLKLEKNKKLNKFYAEYKQGTVVMTNFGVNVGSEMSMPHFAVVLSSKDTKRDRQVIVVPLTSKFHRNHHPAVLGKNLFKNIVNLLDKRQSEIRKKQKEIITESDSLSNRFNKIASIINTNKELDQNKINELYNKITEIKKEEKYLSLKINNFTLELNEMNKLIDKATSYNKVTYADVYNITAVSKLKISKLKKYNISENVSFDSETINKIKNQLNTII